MYLSEQHEMVRKLTRSFAEKEMEPLVKEIDQTGVFPQHLQNRMGELGFYGIKIPREYGGSGSDCRSFTVVIEELSRVCAAACLYISTPNSLGGIPLVSVGTTAQKNKYLPMMASGEKFFCFALTEPGAGSDAGSLLTTATQDGDSYILNGRKCFITGAPLSDYIIVFAKTDKSAGVKGISSFIVDSRLPGISFGKPEDKMGIIGIPTSDVVLDNVRVSKDDMLGEVNKGFAIAMKALELGRISIAAQALGIAQAAVEASVKYAKERKQFGKSIGQFQAVSFMLADMETKLTTMRLLVYDAAEKVDLGLPAATAGSMAKYYNSETCNEIVYKALQIHGGYGYMKDYTIERLYRDARITTIYEGTSQIQQMVIAGSMLR